jgi:hypothetical protein
MMGIARKSARSTHPTKKCAKIALPPKVNQRF